MQSVVIDPLDRLWILDTGAPRHRTTSYGGPKLMGVDLAQNRIITTILFPPDVALATTYLNDLRFDLRRGEQGMAFLTDSSPQSNGLIVVDLASGQSWRRLHEHPSTKAEKGFLPVVEGQPLMLRPPDGPPQPYRSGVDGIAISHDGVRLFYSALMGRRLFSVSSDALVNRALDDATVAATPQRLWMKERKGVVVMAWNPMPRIVSIPQTMSIMPFYAANQTVCMRRSSMILVCSGLIPSHLPWMAICTLP